MLGNIGDAPVTIDSVTSFLAGGLAGPGGLLEDLELMWAENDWLSEGRWQTRPLRGTDDWRPGQGRRGLSPRMRPGPSTRRGWPLAAVTAPS